MNLFLRSTLQKRSTIKTFDEIPLPPEIRKALKQLNFNQPTEVQKAVMPIAMKGFDIMTCAETGSGKTAAYAIPLVSKLIESPKSVALILAPTRELAQQISDFIRQLTLFCGDKFKVATLIGGADIRKQFKALKKYPRIIVATPGRLNDHLRRETLELKSTKILILDEGDRMLDMGFAPQLNEILKFLPKKRQTSLFTATLSPKVQKLAQTYLYKPRQIQVGQISQPVTRVRQSVVQVKMKAKNDRVVDELNQRKGSVIIFTRTQRRTDSLAKELKSYGFQVDLIHGGRSQSQRNKAINNFKQGHSRILCATDVAARGIDVPQVEHIINFDLPMVDEDYVHRIGRTARNGAYGEAISFVTPEEHHAWMLLAKKYKIKGVQLEGVNLRPDVQKKSHAKARRPNSRNKKKKSRRRSP